MSGWRWCVTGGRHWGIRGAAGLLPFALTPGGARVLLALRSEGTHQGGTWGTVGGAIEAGETPWDAAVREAAEEAEGLPLAGAEPAGSHRYDCRCGWAYTTFPVRVPDDAAVIVPGWENRELRWVPADDVDCYDLHPGLAQSWPGLRKMIEGGRLSRTRQWNRDPAGRGPAGDGAAGDPPQVAGSVPPPRQCRMLRVLESSWTK